MKTTMGVLGAATLWAMASASQACDIRDVRIPGGAVRAEYSGFDSGATVVPAPVTLRGQNCGNARIEYAVLPDPNYPLNAGVLVLGRGGDLLNVELTTPAGVSLLQPQAIDAFSTASPVSRFGATGGDVTDPSLTLRLQPGQDVAPGEYRGRVRLQARGLDRDGEAGKTAETYIDIIIRVPPVMFLTAAAARRIDLGELASQALSEPFAFDAWTNVDYTLVVKSDNQWRLRRPGQSSGGVDYRLNFEGRDVDSPGANANRLTYPTPRGLRRRHDMRLRIDQVDGRPAGVYSDVVTIEIQARV